MEESNSKAVVHVVRGQVANARSSVPAARVGTRALAVLARSSVARRVALAGIAFGVGFQVSRMLRAGGFPELTSTARDVYSSLTGDDPVAEGRLAGRWVRHSVTLVSSVYRLVDPDDR